MKIFILLLIMLTYIPAMAAEQPAQETSQPENDGKKTAAPETKQDAVAEEKEPELACEYYRIELPKGWKTVLPPTEKQGNINAIFSRDDDSSVVTIIVGPTLGADAKTIAATFAEQFKAKKQPVLKNGQYTFAFTQHKVAARAALSVTDDRFMLITNSGDQKQAQSFIKNGITMLAKDAKDAKDAKAADEKAANGAGDAGDKKQASSDNQTTDKSEKSGDNKGSKEAARTDSGAETSSAAAKNAAESKSAPAEKAEKAPAASAEASKAESSENKENPEENDAKSNELACKYYEVTLPEGWKTIMPPTDEQGNINAIFANGKGSTVITLIIGPNLGEDGKSIAGMFAEQFKAAKAPVEKSGYYVFSFTQNGVPATAQVRCAGAEFMLATYVGSDKEARDFFATHIKSSDYADLLPK